MDIQSAVLSTPLAIKATQLSLTQQFLGQILSATVLERKSSDTFVLQIGNQQVEAKANQSRPLNVGDQLKLIVKKQDNPTVLRVVQENSTKPSQEVKQQLLRETIPKQAGMEKLTSILNQVSHNIKQVVKTLPLPIEQQFKKFIEQLPTKTTVNNEAGLKTAIKNSGLFFEAKLLTETIKKQPELFLKSSNRSIKPSVNPTSTQLPQQAIAKDLKTNLLQLASVISKHKPSVETLETSLVKQTQISLPDKNQNIAAKTRTIANALDLSLKADTEVISKQIESSIARIEVNQSKAVVSNDNQAAMWSVELPVKDKQDIDLLKLNIQADKDSNSSDPEEQVWSTNININFENIGTISAKLSINNKEVNATLWSDNGTLSELINNNLSLLNNQIEKCGLATGKIICLEEAPVEQKVVNSNQNLINITI